MFTGRPDTWRYRFRVTVLTRAGSTTFPWINPAPCERRTVLLLTSCAVCYLSVRDSNTAHSTINATANHALNVMVLCPARVLKPRLLALVRLALGAALLSFRLVNALWRLIRDVSPCLVCVGLVVGRGFRSCCYTVS